MKYLKDYLASRMLHLLRKHRFESPLLDAGCGTGNYLRSLAGYYQATGIDLSVQAIELCASEGLDCRCMSLYDVREKYSSIVCIDVLEHLEDDVSFLEKMFEILSDDGKAFILVPSGPFRQDDVYFGHYRRYARSEINAKVLDCGFQVLHSESFGYPFLHYSRLIMLSTHDITSSEELGSNEKRTCSSSYRHYADDTMLGRLISGLEKAPLLNAALNMVLSAQQVFAGRENGFAQIVIAWKPPKGRAVDCDAEQEGMPRPPSPD